MPKGATIQEIINGAKAYLPKFNPDRVLKAYEVAKKAHEGQTRSSGEPYITHPLEVAKILMTLKPDEDSIIVALLHDVVEDTEVKMEDLEKEFGKSVTPLLMGMEKLSTVYYRGKERQVENLRKMFLAMAKDIRVILVKLADRLHNMRTLDFVPEHKRARIAEETLTVYAPIASRLGIYAIKDELEDLCFRHLLPKEYENITGEMKELTGLQQNIIKTSKKILTSALRKSDIEVKDVYGRIKNPYSIYKKLRRKGKNYVNELYDVLALRVIVKDEGECYQTLGVLHKHWTPLPYRFKDYIGHPKPNGYQSLHTTLIGLTPDLHNQPIEVQIRSEAMEQVAAYGIAAHWKYKEAGGRSIAVEDDKLHWVKSLVNLQESIQSHDEFIESLNVDIFKDRIFVLTPKGDVKDLPVNATPIDFAYAVHTEVGHKCKSAKVNGKIVPLNHPLKNGEVIEILTGPNPQPNRYWLSFVITSHAKSSIKQWFNLQDKEKLVKLGKDLVNAQLQRYNQPLLDPTLNLLKEMDGQKLTLRDREFVLEKIGNGSISAVSVVKKIVPVDALMRPMEENRMEKAMTNKVQLGTLPEVLITGERGLKTSMATCCNPGVNDDIIGYITRGKGITIHKKDCKVVKGNQPERLVKATWSTKKVSRYGTKLLIERQSRIGLLRDIAAVFANNELPILDLVMPDDKPMTITSSVDSFETLNKVIDELEMIPGVNSVKESH